MKESNENRVNVVIPENYNGSPIEVVIRQGEAAKVLDPKEPNRVDIQGTIESLFRWIEKRINLIDQAKTHILVDRDCICMKLSIDESDYYRTSITGLLELSNKIKEFGINTNKTWDPQKLSQFFKMNRAFFPDKTKNMELVTLLKNFKAKISQNVEQSREETGSRTDNFSQIVDSNLPSAFKITIPLFKGMDPEEIEVEIYADIDGRNVSLTLVSPGAEELLELYRNKVIDEEIKKISELAPNIVFIEK